MILLVALAGFAPAAPAAVWEFTNSDGILVQDGNAAIPSPSIVDVAGVTPGQVTSLRMRINGITHSNTSDVDIFLVSPAGFYCGILTDVGDGFAVSDVNLVLDDDAATAMPEAGQLTSGTYRPSSYNPPDVLPPDGSEDGCLDKKLNSLARRDMNGVWKLYVKDDNANSQPGSITSWSLVIETLVPAPLSTARTGHTSTLLPSGKILVAGGSGMAGSLTSTELFDPGTGTWSASGPLGFARSEHTATLLPNGKVLVTGGSNGSSIASAELYDPHSGTWSATNAMGTARNEHTATLLANGKVLVTGGLAAAGFNSLTSSELYDPVTESWSPTTGSLNTRRYNHSATMLADGKVLVVGGYDTSIFLPLATAELFDPATGLWSFTTGTLGVERQGHSATLLTSGRVLVVGGSNNNVGTLNTSEEYNPDTGTWGFTTVMANKRTNHTATLMPYGRVLVAGGEAADSVLSVETYHPISREWITSSYSLGTARAFHTATLMTSGRVLVAGGFNSTSGVVAATDMTGDDLIDGWFVNALALQTARNDHTATLLANGQVLVTGGRDIDSDSLASTEYYNPLNGLWTVSDALDTARSAHTATFLRNGKVLVAGGSNNFLGILGSSEEYDPATGMWTASAGSLTNRYSHTATLLNNGKVLVAGGRSGPAMASAEIYDPLTGLWSVTGSLGTARYAHTATLLANGKVLVAGGIGGSEVLASAEIYDPAGNAGAGSWSATAPMFARTDHTASLLPSGEVLVVGGNNSGELDSAQLYDPALGTWKLAGKLAHARYLHAATVLRNGMVLVSGGVGVSNSEVYDPAAGAWYMESPLTTSPAWATTTLLADGNVLLAGGFNGSVTTNAALLYNSAHGTSVAWRPAISTATVNAQDQLVLTGAGFMGLSGASGGNGAQDSSTAYPLVQWRSLENDQSVFLLPDPSSPFTSTGFVSQPLEVSPGFAMVTVFANGIPGKAFIVFFEGAPPPELSVSPAQLQKTLAPNTAGVLQLSIENIGGQNLDWLAFEQDIGAPGGASAGGADCSGSQDMPWLSIAPISGSTAPGNTNTLEITFNATGLFIGEYTGSICLSSNDPATPLVEVPVSLTVAIPVPLVCNGATLDFETGIPLSFTTSESGNLDVKWVTTADDGFCKGVNWSGINETPGTGEAGCVDSDLTNQAGTAYDARLITNSIDLGPYLSASLNFAAAYQDIGGIDKFDVDVSINAGSTWTNALSWDQNHMGPGEMVNINLAPYLGQADVRVRFRYYGQGWDWWAQVDDISLSCVTTDGIFSGGFESP